MNSQRRIRATSAPDALQRITELYNGTFADAIAETLQNARRAGADTVLIDARIGAADGAPDDDRVSIIRRSAAGPGAGGEPAPDPLDPDRQRRGLGRLQLCVARQPT